MCPRATVGGWSVAHGVSGGGEFGQSDFDNAKAKSKSLEEVINNGGSLGAIADCSKLLPLRQVEFRGQVLGREDS